LKAGKNWWNVLTDKKPAHQALVDPILEMMFFLVAEIFTESIPMTLLQVYKILTFKGDLDPFVLVALFTSAYFVAENISYITHKKDVNEESR